MPEQNNRRPATQNNSGTAKKDDANQQQGGKTAAEILAERQQRAQTRKVKLKEEETNNTATIQDIVGKQVQKILQTVPEAPVLPPPSNPEPPKQLQANAQDKKSQKDSSTTKTPSAKVKQHDTENSANGSASHTSDSPGSHHRPSAAASSQLISPQPVIHLESGPRIMTPNRLKKIASMYSTADPAVPHVDFSTTLRGSEKFSGWSASNKPGKISAYNQEIAMSGKSLAETLRSRHSRTGKRLPGRFFFVVCV